MRNTIIAFFLLLSFSVFGQAQGVKAEKFAIEIAKRLMDEITPGDGNNPGAYVYNWDYEPLFNRYTIHLMATWYAKTCLFCSSATKFEVTGFLEINRDGQNPVFSETNRNQAVKAIIGESDISKIIKNNF